MIFIRLKGYLVLKYVKVLKISIRELNFFNKFKMLFFWLGYLVIMKVWEWLVVIISNVLLLFVIFLVIWIVLLNIMVFDKVMVVWEVWWLWFIWFFLWNKKKV